MLKAKFYFNNYYVVCQEGEVAKSGVIYYSDSTGQTPLNPQPTVGSTLSFPTFKTWETETTDIVRDSLEITSNRLNGVRSSSNSASFILRRQPFFDHEGRRTLIGVLGEGVYTAEVKIYEDDDCIFTGCILPSSTSWGVSSSGNSDVSIHIYDITALRLKKMFSTEAFDFVTYNGTLADLVKRCSEMANLPTVSTEIEELEDINVVTKISIDSTLQDVLDTALYEHNRVYYTDADGVLHIEEINLDKEVDFNLWSSDDSPEYEEGDPLLYNHGGVAIQRRVNSPNNYKNTVMSYIPLAHVEDAKVWELTTDDGGAVTISSHCFYNGYFSTEISTDDFPTVETGTKNTGWFSSTNRFRMIIPSSASWNAIVLKARTYKSGGGYWGSKAYLERMTTTTETRTEYDEEGNPYEVSEDIIGYETISNVISLGDEWERELNFTINDGVDITEGEIYFTVHKNCNFLEFSSMHTVVASNCVRWVSTMESLEASPSKVTLYDYDTHLPLWWVGDLYVSSSPSTYDSRVKVQEDVDGRPCSTTTTLLIDNTDNSSPISAKWTVKADELYRATTSEEYPEVVIAEVGNIVEGESFNERMSYAHTSEVAKPHAELLARMLSMSSCSYVFYTDEYIEPLSVVVLNDNMWSALRQKMMVTSVTKTYRKGGVYKYTASAISPSEAVKVRYPSARYNTVVARPEDGEDGKSSLYFGTRSWTQTQVDAHAVGTSHDFTNSLGVEVKVGDTIWLSINNTTTGKSATLYCLVESVTGSTPHAKVISYIWEGSDGADGGEYSLSIVGSTTFTRDKRNGTSQSLPYTVYFKGYNPTTDTVTISSSSTQATVTRGTATTETLPFTLSIPYTNTVDSVTLTVSVSHTEGSKTWEDFSKIELSVNETTRYNVYKGALSSLPSSNNIEGDYCFYTVDMKPRYYNGTSWVELNDPSVPSDRVSLMCSDIQKDALDRIPSGSVSSSEWAYFSTLIANTVTANYIKSQTGVFDGITVTDADVRGSLTSGDTYIVNRNATDWTFPQWHTGTIHWGGETIEDAHYYTQEELKWLIDAKYFCFTNFGEIGMMNPATPLSPIWATYNNGQILWGAPTELTGHTDFNYIVHKTWPITEEGYVWVQTLAEVPTLKIDNCFFFSNPSSSTTEAYPQIVSMFPVDGFYSFDEGAIAYTDAVGGATTHLMATEECPIIIQVTRLPNGYIQLKISGFVAVSKGSSCYEPDVDGGTLFSSILNVSPTFAGPVGWNIYLGGSRATVSSDSILPTEVESPSLRGAESPIGTKYTVSRSQLGAPARPFGDLWTQRAHITHRLDARQINSQDTSGVVWGAVFN